MCLTKTKLIISLLITLTLFTNESYAQTKKQTVPPDTDFLEKILTLANKRDANGKYLVDIAGKNSQFSSQADKILVIKSKRRLYFQRSGKTFLSFPCALGRNPVGDKQRAGDMKTPEGMYRLIGKTTQVKYYKAYLISYPDCIHIARALKLKVSPGDQIMVHGTDKSKANAKDWTNGCIAISNAGMDSLFKYVTPSTPIEIRK